MPDGGIGADRIDEDQLRAECQRLIDSEGLTQKQIAEQSGIPYGTFTPWFRGKYDGNTTSIARRVRYFLDAREHVSRVNQAVIEPEFVETSVATQVKQQLNFARLLPEIALIVTPPGCGKTKCAEHCAEIWPNSFLITAHVGMNTVSALNRKIASRLDLTGPTSSLFDKIGLRLRGRKPLLMIDEAQFLSVDMIENMRSLFDIYDIGIAFLGNHSILRTMVSDPRGRGFSQLVSRVGSKKKFDRPTDADRAQVIRSWGVDDPAAIRELQMLGKKPGYLPILKSA